MAVELRSHLWLSPENATERLDFFTSYALPYVVMDMPQGHRSSIPPIVAATADLAVVRFHGHSQKWDSKDMDDRFGYRYSEEELARWAYRSTIMSRPFDLRELGGGDAFPFGSWPSSAWPDGHQCLAGQHDPVPVEVRVRGPVTPDGVNRAHSRRASAGHRRW